jgi:hypothetical protein
MVVLEFKTRKSFFKKNTKLVSSNQIPWKIKKATLFFSLAISVIELCRWSIKLFFDKKMIMLIL